jgi:transcriptional regulator with XRE-family HTH domain
MPTPLKLNETAPYAVKAAARRLGERIRLARKRRSLTLRELASKAGIAYDTCRAVEQGNLMTGIGAYFALIWAMGLESEFAGFLDSDRDEEGKQLELGRTPQRVRHRTKDSDNDF